MSTFDSPEPLQSSLPFSFRVSWGLTLASALCLMTNYALAVPQILSSSLKV